MSEVLDTTAETEITNQAFKAYCSAFVNFQSEVTSAEEDGQNPFLKSKYATLASIIRTLREPLTKNGLSFTQEFIYTENGYRVNTNIRHIEGYSETVIFDSMMPKPKDAQALGSLSTYLKRYALVSVFGLSTGDEDDGQLAVEETKKQNGSQTKNTNTSTLTEERLNKAVGLIMNEQDINKLDNLLMAVSKQGANDQQYKRATNAYNKRKDTLSQEAFNNA